MSTLSASPEAECEHCHNQFVRRSTMQKLCGSYRCAIGWIKARDKAARSELKRRKEAAKPRKTLMAEAQQAFNAFIRERDHGKLCICCNAQMNWASNKPGGEIDAGHYLSVGSAPELRFDEANVHAQRKSCNRPGGAKRDQFRLHLAERIGWGELWRLEGPNPAKKYTADDLRAIRDEYRSKAKALRAAAKQEAE